MMADYFYCSAYTASGFKWYFMPKEDEKAIIIKGFGENAKKRIIESAEDWFCNKNIKVEALYDSRSEKRVGLYAEKCGLWIADGNSPYNIEPITYGANDRIFNLSDFQNCDELQKESKNIIELLLQANNNRARCNRFITAGGKILRDIKKLEAQGIDEQKINRFCSKYWSKHGEKPTGRVGTVTKRFYSHITEDSVKSGLSFNKNDYDNMLIIEDKCGYAAELIIDKIRRYALGSGLDVIALVDVLSLEGNSIGIIVPAVKMAVLGDTKYSAININYSKRIHASRFSEKSASKNKQRIDFTLKALDNVLHEAGISDLNEQKSIESVNKVYDSVTNEILLTEYTQRLLCEMCEI